MRRREFIALMGASVTWPFAAMAQQPGRTYRLGCLWSVPPDTPLVTAFFDQLRRWGFVEGQNLTVEYRSYGQHVDLIPQYAAELDVIATAGEGAVRAVQQATKTIPIVAIVAICWGPDWSTRWRGQMAIQRASVSLRLRLKANDRTS
jgi:putative ABC transport system substrate-binding protein